MPRYAYKAIDANGKTAKGELTAPNELAASTELARQGLMPISVTFKEQARAGLLTRLFKRKKKKRVSTQALIVFTRQFATIVKAAVPIVEGLGVLAEQAEDLVLKEAVRQVIRDVEEGLKLSEAMSKHPAVFSDLYVNTVVAGEAGGVLDKVLLRLADVLEEEQETMTNVKAALRYPIMVVVALMVAIFILSVAVIPNFIKIYSKMNVVLPFPTRVMIFISNLCMGPWKDSPNVFLKFSWYFIVAGSLFAVAFLARSLISIPKGRVWWDGLKFKMVIMGKIYNKVVMLRFASMLNVLYQAGLPILKIIDIVKVTIGNVVLAKELEGVKKDVADGKGVSGGVLGSKLFPRMVGYMISIGEKTGSLPAMLDSLCDYFSLEVKTAVRNLTSLIEPLMTLVLGVVVAFMALAIFLPMWDLIKVLKQ